MRIFETIGALIVLVVLLPLLYDVWNMGATEIKKRQAAEHLSLVNKAAGAYVRKHGADLLVSTSPTSGPELTVGDLITEELLSTGFSSRNVWQQTYRIYVRRPKNNELQAVTLTTAGRGHDAREPEFANAVIPSTAAMLGGAGGFVPTGIVPGTTADTLHGAFGGWVIPFASLAIPSPGPGHLGALATFDGSSLDQDFLYRVAVPGHPELNAMQTELDMRDHAIRGLHEAQFVERTITSETCVAPEEQGRLFLDRQQGLYLCRNNALENVSDTGNSSPLKAARLVENGDTISKPLCAPGTGTVPHIFTAPSLAEAGPVAPPLNAFQTWATSESDTAWRVHLRVLTSDTSLSPDGWVYPTGNYAKIMALTTCAKAVTP